MLRKKLQNTKNSVALRRSPDEFCHHRKPSLRACPRDLMTVSKLPGQFRKRIGSRRLSFYKDETGDAWQGIREVFFHTIQLGSDRLECIFTRLRVEKILMIYILSYVLMFDTLANEIYSDQAIECIVKYHEIIHPDVFAMLSIKYDHLQR